VIADLVDRVEQAGVGREVEIRAEPSEGGDDPVEDLGFHVAPGATLEVGGNLLGAVRCDLAVEEGLQDPSHLAATQPGSFWVLVAPSHRCSPEGLTPSTARACEAVARSKEATRSSHRCFHRCHIGVSDALGHGLDNELAPRERNIAGEWPNWSVKARLKWLRLAKPTR
jgi:hypothetical protein